MAIMANALMSRNRWAPSNHRCSFVRYVARSQFSDFHGDEDVMVKQVKFVGIPVRDQDKALAFWTKKIGLQIATDQPMGNGQRWIELKIPGADTGLVLFTPQGHENRIGSFQNMSLAVDDVEKTYRELSERGVEFIQPPKKESWGTSAVFKDPDGNLFIIGK